MVVHLPACWSITGGELMKRHDPIWLAYLAALLFAISFALSMNIAATSNGGLWDVCQPPNETIWTPAVVDAPDSTPAAQEETPHTPEEKGELPQGPRRVWGIIRYERVGWFRRKPVYGWKNVPATRKESLQVQSCLGST